jgi:hypothetical protein
MSSSSSLSSQKRKSHTCGLESITSIVGILISNSILVVAVAKGNPNVVLVFTFLYKISEIFTDYFKELEDESLRDNFVITYELLDEMMDHGYPQITESKVLKEFIKTESYKLTKEEKITDIKVPTAASNAIHWRPDGIKHSKNEVFLDVIEKLNMLVSLLIINYLRFQQMVMFLVLKSLVTSK